MYVVGSVGLLIFIKILGEESNLMKTISYRIAVFLLVLSLSTGPVAPVFAQEGTPVAPTEAPIEELPIVTPTETSLPLETIVPTETAAVTETPVPAVTEAFLSPAWKEASNLK
jgi:hypothetical protein